MSDPIRIVVDKSSLNDEQTPDQDTTTTTTSTTNIDEIKAHGDRMLQELVREGKQRRKSMRSDSNVSSMSAFEDFTDALSSVRMNSSVSVLLSAENLSEPFSNVSIGGNRTINRVENSIDEVISGEETEEGRGGVNLVQNVERNADNQANNNDNSSSSNISGSNSRNNDGDGIKNDSDTDTDADADIDDDSTDSDFGSFSDASYENDTTFIADDQWKEDEAEVTKNNMLASMNKSDVPVKNEYDVTRRCLQELFGDITVPDSEQQHLGTYQLEDLLSEKRPRVVYHKLMDKGLDIPPFIWNKSYIRSTVLNILRIPDPLAAKGDNNNDITSTALNDSLFTSICNLLSGDDTAIRPNGLILKENFNIKYIPHLSQHTLRDEDAAEREANIPHLLDPSNLESRTDNIQDYHDELCNSIDQLIHELKSIRERVKQLNEEKITLEHVVTNLSGHTQRLQRDQIALYNKKRKQHARWKRFSLINR